MITAYHFLRSDYRSGSGAEPPWTVGEQRKIKGRLKLCGRGYHSCPTLFDALQYAPGPLATVVEIDWPFFGNGTKQVSRKRRLIKAVDVSRELRLFAADCAERALLRERENGREPDVRSWAAVTAVRQFVNGEISAVQLQFAASAARVAYADAAPATAYAAHAAYCAAASVAYDAAIAAYYAATTNADAYAAANADRAAAYVNERDWQRQRFDELVTARLLADEGEGK